MKNKPEYDMRVGITIFTLLVFNCLPYVIGERSIENARIVIIGAGASGIAAASKLFEKGFKNITILEAENRIGGRAYSTKFGDYIVDVGAQFIVGTKGNVVYELVNPFGLVAEANETGSAGIFFNSKGNSVNDEIVDNINNFAKDLYGGKMETGLSFKSVGEYTEHLFNQRFKDIPSIMNEKQKYLFYLELLTIGESASSTWYELSALAGNQYKNYAGDNYVFWKNPGYSTFLDILMKRYPDSEKELPVKKNIVLNSEVISIDYSQETDILVTTSTGQVYKADHVIVTISLGYLKAKHNTLFKPQLPTNKINTIEAIGYGDLEKIYLLFDKPFWSLDNKSVVEFVFIWDDADKKVIQENPEKEWLLGIVGANTVFCKPNLLEFWVVGKYGKLMGKLSEETILNHTMENLRRFLGKNYSIPVPIGMMRSQWFVKPYFRGAYAFRSVETEQRNVSATTLEEPLKQNNLTVMFAGEATSSDRYGTVDGAVGTGWKAADRLIELYESSSIPSNKFNEEN